MLAFWRNICYTNLTMYDLWWSFLPKMFLIPVERMSDMSMGFRKSMFGFKRGDVHHYIDDLNKSHSEKQWALERRVSALTEEINQLRQELANANAEKFRIEHELKEYTDKYDEIERLSQNIGKLYLVAQSNARAIMKNSDENRDAVRREVESNLDSIDSTHVSLDEIKTKMLETSSEFVSRLEDLMSSLESARSQISDNDTDNDGKVKDFETLYSELSK